MAYSEKEIGDALRRVRERAGLSQSELARRLGMSLDAVKRFEYGERVYYWQTVGRVADALGCTPNEILGYPSANSQLVEIALRPILAEFGLNPEDADDIARVLFEAAADAQSLPADVPADLRYKISGQLAASRLRREKI